MTLRLAESPLFCYLPLTIIPARFSIYLSIYPRLARSPALDMQPTGRTDAPSGEKRQMEAEDGICSSQETTVTLGGPRHKQRVESLPTAAEAAAIARVQAEAARCDREEANATASGLLTAERATTLATQALTEATATADAAATAAEATANLARFLEKLRSDTLAAEVAAAAAAQDEANRQNVF